MSLSFTFSFDLATSASCWYNQEAGFRRVPFGHQLGLERDASRFARLPITSATKGSDFIVELGAQQV